MSITRNTEKESTYYSQRLEDLAQFNKEHKEDLKNSTNAGCYYCCTIYPADTIVEWVKSYRRKGVEEKEDCALCPNCSIDSVLPDSKVELSEELLKEMYEYWFNDSPDF